MLSSMAVSWLVCGLIAATIFLVACYRSHHGITFTDVWNAMVIAVLGYISVGVCMLCLAFLWVDKEY